MTTSDVPPPFDPTSTVKLVSGADSKIINVSLYSGRAEITRLFRFSVKTGLNKVHISGLPNVLDNQSLRVEGRGEATIHDVTVSRKAPIAPVNTSHALEALEMRRNRTLKAIQRCQKSIASVETFLGTLNIQHIEAEKLANVLQNYDAVGENLDDKLYELEKELKEIDQDIRKERINLNGRTDDDKLRMEASIGVFADVEDEVEITLLYAVSQANWDAAYDVRVDMQTKETPVTLIYKAAITQNTGESWDDVPLTLETASPTYGVNLPPLHPWTLSVYKPMPLPPAPAAAAPIRLARARMSASAPRSIGFSGDDDMDVAETSVTSKGNVNATFRVPGLVSIPCDGGSHNFTIAQLSLSAVMSWVVVPKKDTKVHLKARIKNASDYTFLAGVASVYVDGSFISRSDVPPVSPQESFDCPLGLDPSIRITYHPRSKNASQSGLYSKTSILVFTQRLTIHNLKTTPVDRLKIVDQIPVSEDSQISVKLISPPLPDLGSLRASRTSISTLPSHAIKVADGVSAQWDGADETAVDLESLGNNGKLNWLCFVPPQGKVNVTLQWEVTSPVKTNIVGL